MQNNKGLGSTILRYSSAFTIVELLVVIVIIGILATLTIVSYTNLSTKATIASLTSDLDNASKQLKLDQVINSGYPTTLASANSGKGIPASAGTTYEYIYNNNSSPQMFCITATNSLTNTSYKITNDTSPTLGTCQTPGIVTDGLVLNLDAGNSLSYPGSGTTWNDLSGNGYNATIFGSSVWTSADGGKFDYADIAQTSQYIRLPDSAPRSTSTSYTIELWMKPLSSNAKYFNTFSTTTNANYSLMEQDTESFKKYGYVSGTLPYTNNETLQFSIVRDNSDTGLFYKNGSTPIESTGIGLINGVAVNGWILNHEQDSVGGSFDPNQNYRGAFMIIRLYNRALSASELLQNYNAIKDRYGL